jgi:hypothetical protein
VDQKTTSLCSSDVRYRDPAVSFRVLSRERRKTQDIMAAAPEAAAIMVALVPRIVSREKPEGNQYGPRNYQGVKKSCYEMQRYAAPRGKIDSLLP